MPESTKQSSWKWIRTWTCRRHYSVWALLVLSVVLAGLCVALGLPFVAPLIWALLLAVLMQPLHRWMSRRIRFRSAATLLAIAVVMIVVVLPLVLALTEITVEISRNVGGLQSGQSFQDWLQVINRNAWLGRAVEWLQARIDLRDQVGSAAQSGVKLLSGLMLGSVYALVEWLVAFYMLFFFLRDRHVLLAWASDLLPLNRSEAALVFAQIRDTLYAVALGSLLVSLGQGLAVGFAFWATGLPSPLMWGGIMAIFALVPVIGTSSVWVCATAYLLLQGEWQRALVVATCGAAALSIIDNVLYPMLVKGRLDMHPVPVFIAVVGGVMCFGPTGIVLGPLILSATQTIRHIWQQRMASQLAEEAAHTASM